MAVRGVRLQQNQQQDWLQCDGRLTGSSAVAYKLRYIGCISVRVSIKSVDLELRTKIAHSCIRRVCEQAGLRQPANYVGEYGPMTALIGQAADRTWSMTDVHLTVTSHALTVESFGFNWLMFHHDLCRVSFASSGDSEFGNFVCYVAKNDQGKRVCHVFECPQGSAQDVMLTFSQAFHLGYQDFKRAHLPSSTGRSPQPSSDLRCPNGDNETTHRLHRLPSDSVSGVDNCSLFPTECDPMCSLSIPHYHMSPFANRPRGPANCGISPTDMNSEPGAPPKESPPPLPADTGDLVDFSDDICLLQNEISHCPSPQNRLPSIPHALPSPRQRPAPPSSTMSTVDRDRFASLEPVGEPWYVGKMSRPKAEALLRYEGDFLVRASAQQDGQFVLSGLKDGKCRHLLLVDPQGKVRTRERVFDSIQHLIDFHVQTGNPICSADSELRLVFPVSGQTFP